MGFFEVLWAYVLVFLLASVPFFEAVAIVPIAILAGLSAIPVTILGFVGNFLTVILVIIFVEKIKQWRRNRKGKQEEGATESESKRTQRAQKIWNKYGMPGLTIIGPLIVGSHLTALMALSLGGTKRAVAYWLTGSLAFWCVLFAVLTHFGIDFLNVGEGGFLIGIFNK
ncbi:small multi-drug export protein [Halalkalibacter lacteus]|uniref:small multi-drug export protein n=1 Tax=Halalkalibacter lacteus TaxID=3090663 RepID=UPI002FC95C3C